MPNPYFRFKQFNIQQDRCAMKVTTDASLFGAWCSRMIAAEEVRSILDMGAGTGLLSLMIAQNTTASIVAVEIDQEAGTQAAANCAASPFASRVQVVNADIRTWQATARFDVVVSNPPFYENELRSAAPKKNLAHHSESLSLSELTDAINRHLKEEGFFFLLLPYKRKQEAEQMLKEKGFYVHHMTIVRQSVLHEPFRIMIRGGRKAAGQIKEDGLAIWNREQQYTEDFIALLKDYYLYL